MSDAVAFAAVSLVAVPLERPITLTRGTIVEREYVVLRVRTEDGIEGAAIGYTRGLPLRERLNELLVGGDAVDPDVRAASLVDIALWDVEARRAELPLWRLLGGAKPRVPILAVGGYFREQRTVEDVEDELRRLAEEGYRHLKVHAHEPELVSRLRAAVPDVDFSIDADMCWRELGEATEACRRLDGLGLAFIEDPFPPDQPGLTRALAEAIETPIAAGEDAAGREALLDLAAAADVLRIDATASGGIDAAVAGDDARVRRAPRPDRRRSRCGLAHGDDSVRLRREPGRRAAGGDPARRGRRPRPLGTTRQRADLRLGRRRALLPDD